MIKRKNPKDEEILKKIRIKKEFIPGDESDSNDMIKYMIMLNDKEIGVAGYIPSHREVWFVEIKKEYQRLGIGTFLYDYIESDQQIKLKPSDSLKPLGKLFWENRLKKNPTDKEFLKRLRITKEYDVPGTSNVWYTAYLDSILVGEALYHEGGKNIIDVWVEPEYRQMGVATYLYDMIEKDYDVKLEPSSSLSKYSTKLWQKRLKKNPVKHLPRYKTPKGYRYFTEPKAIYFGGAIHYINKEGKLVHSNKMEDVTSKLMTKTQFNKKFGDLLKDKEYMKSIRGMTV